MSRPGIYREANAASEACMAVFTGLTKAVKIIWTQDREKCRRWMKSAAGIKA